MKERHTALLEYIAEHGKTDFHVDKLFAGTDGYSRDFGFTGDDLARCDTLSAMTECADHVYILTDSGKFFHPGGNRRRAPQRGAGFSLKSGNPCINCLNIYKNLRKISFVTQHVRTKRSPPEIFLIFLCILLSCLS